MCGFSLYLVHCTNTPSSPASKTSPGHLAPTKPPSTNSSAISSTSSRRTSGSMRMPTRTVKVLVMFGRRSPTARLRECHEGSILFRSPPDIVRCWTCMLMSVPPAKLTSRPLASTTRSIPYTTSARRTGGVHQYSIRLISSISYRGAWVQGIT